MDKEREREKDGGREWKRDRGDVKKMEQNMDRKKGRPALTIAEERKKERGGKKEGKPSKKYNTDRVQASGSVVPLDW